MIVTRIAAILCLLALAATAASAQLSASISIDPALAGDTYLIRLTDESGLGAIFPDTCIVNEARAASIDGPTVWSASGCGDQPTVLGPNGWLTHTWLACDNGGNPLEMGIYQLCVSYLVPGGSMLVDQWFPLEHVPQSPQLRRHSEAFVGESAVMSIVAPAYVGGRYVAAASTLVITTMVVGEPFSVLVADALFAFSLANPNGGLFDGFQGPIPDTGLTSELRVNIPGLPSLAGLHFNVQALVVPADDLGPAPRLTNIQPFTIAVRD